MGNQFKLRVEHPKRVLNLIVEGCKLDLTFEFSIYEDLRGSTDNDRQFIQIPARQVSDELVLTMIKDLPKGKELALNSRVLDQYGKLWHIPMVDFATAALAQTQKLASVLPSKIFEQMVWFDSGRSFHGYGLALIDHNQWVELMGRLLLVNRSGYTAIIDPRWIGHRLIAGYSALRWSKNTSKYLHAPTLAHPADKHLSTELEREDKRSLISNQLINRRLQIHRH